MSLALIGQRSVDRCAGWSEYETWYAGNRGTGSPKLSTLGAALLTFGVRDSYLRASARESRPNSPMLSGRALAGFKIAERAADYRQSAATGWETEIARLSRELHEAP